MGDVNRPSERPPVVGFIVDSIRIVEPLPFDIGVGVAVAAAELEQIEKSFVPWAKIGLNSMGDTDAFVRGRYECVWTEPDADGGRTMVPDPQGPRYYCFQISEPNSVAYQMLDWLRDVGRISEVEMMPGPDIQYMQTPDGDWAAGFGSAPHYAVRLRNSEHRYDVPDVGRADLEALGRLLLLRSKLSDPGIERSLRILADADRVLSLDPPSE